MRYLFLLSAFLLLFACKTSVKLVDLPPPPPPVADEPPPPPMPAPKTDATLPVPAPKEGISQASIVKKLYEGCNTCKISICKRNGETYYSTEMNAYDVGTSVYDAKGNHFVNCNYMKKDPKCNFETCEIVFVPAKNIWGLKGVDKFGLLD